MVWLLVVLFIIGVIAIGYLLADEQRTEQTAAEAHDLWQEAQERER
jgi:preprotein translocase subunit SecG